jgi:LPS export ABC transporter permease LptG
MPALRPKRITRYMLFELFTPTVLGLMLWTFVLLMNHFFFVAEKALAKNLGFDLTLRLFLTGVPAILILTIPMAVLLGSLIAVGRVSSDNEWVALQGAGLGPRVLLKPLLLHGLAASLVTLYFYAELVPRSNYTRRHLQGQILLSSSLASDLKPRVFYTELQDVVLYVDDILPAVEEDSPDTGHLRGILLIQSEPSDNNFEVILARSGELYPASDRSGTLIADLYNGVGSRYNPDDPETYYRLDFESHREPIPPPPYLENFLAPPDKVVSDMSISELIGEFRSARGAQQKRIRELESSGRDPTDRQARFLVDNRVNVATVELSARLALPMSSMVFVLLALPLGITRARSGKGAGFAVSLIVILVYWGTYTFFRDQSLVGKLPAWLGPWIANLILLPWAGFSIWRMRRPRDTSSGPVAWLVVSAIRSGRWVRRWITFRRRRTSLEDASELDGVEALEQFGGTSTRFVIRLDQYVGLHYLRVLVFSLAAAYLVAALVEFRGLMDDLLRTKQSPALLLQYFQYFAPTMLHIVLPISCLIGAVVSYTLLTRTGELTAIKANGISMRRATVPVLFLTSLLCLVLFLVEDSVAPVARRLAQETQDKIMGRAPKTYGLSAGGRWGFADDGKTLYHYQLFDPDRKEFQGLTVFTVDRETPRILAHRYAKRARWKGTTAELEDGWYRNFDTANGEAAYEVYEGVRTEQLDPPAQLAAKQMAITDKGGISEQMSLKELDQEIDVLKKRGYDTTHLQVAFHGKISRSVAPLVMVLLGLPFAFRVGRRGSLYGVGVALLLVLAYWAVFALFNALGLETVLEPWAAAWAPNVLFGLLGTYMMLYIRT